MDYEINALSADTGVEVHGVDLTRTPNVETIAALNKAFSDHSVLVVRDQRMDPHQMVDTVQHFGEIFPQHNSRFALPECPQIHYISNQDKHADGTRYIPGEGYHTDHSNDAHPPKATVLLAISLPDVGGDTQFVNMHRAYEDLPAETKQRIDGLKAVHVYQSKHSTCKLLSLPKGNDRDVPAVVVHPLVRTHPETGRKALYINPIRIKAIEGMDEPEALELLDELLEHATQEKYQYRYKWRNGDLVMWDNRCLLHKANGDYEHAQTRLLYRVMLKGGTPV